MFVNIKCNESPIVSISISYTPWSRTRGYCNEIHHVNISNNSAMYEFVQEWGWVNSRKWSKPLPNHRICEYPSFRQWVLISFVDCKTFFSLPCLNKFASTRNWFFWKLRYPEPLILQWKGPITRTLWWGPLFLRNPKCQCNEPINHPASVKVQMRLRDGEAWEDGPSSGKTSPTSYSSISFHWQQGNPISTIKHQHLGQWLQFLNST